MYLSVMSRAPQVWLKGLSLQVLMIFTLSYNHGCYVKSRNRCFYVRCILFLIILLVMIDTFKHVLDGVRRVSMCNGPGAAERLYSQIERHEVHRKNYIQTVRTDSTQGNNTIYTCIHRK